MENKAMRNNKDFDEWNIDKKYIHSYRDNKLYRKRDIWWCFLGMNIGFEEDGTGSSHQRPVIILRGFSSNVCLIVPLTTSRKKSLYNFHLGLVDDKEAAAIISQIRLIDTKRLINKIGVIDEETFSSLRKAIRHLI